MFVVFVLGDQTVFQTLVCDAVDAHGPVAAPRIGAQLFHRHPGFAVLAPDTLPALMSASTCSW